MIKNDERCKKGNKDIFFLLQMYMYNKNIAITLYIVIHMYIK